MDEIKIDLTPVLNRIGAFVKAEAVKMCPVDQGDLRRSIDYRIEGNDTVVIFANAPNAESMEYGEPPSPEGIFGQEADDIRKWAERHNANPWHIIKGIEKHGIKVGTKEKPIHITSYGRNSYRPFLRPAYYMNVPKINKIIETTELKIK